MPANPPIIVGELDNVPAPGSPIASAWAQDVSTRVLQRFANVAERNALYPAPPDGAECVTLDTYTFWLSHAGAWIDATLSGAAGPAGPAGATGAQGDPGESGNSILSAFWTYNPTTSSPPAVGQCRSPSTPTTLWVHKTDTDGFDRTAGLASVTVGQSIYVRAQNGTKQNLLITAIADSGVYMAYTVTVSSGAITKGARTQLNFVAAETRELPAGGTAGQSLVKASATDYAVAWGGSPVVSKATAPVAADYGLATIPVGAIWVQR